MLMSISHLTKVGCQVAFDGGICQIFNLDHHLLGQVHITNGLYKIQCDYSATMATAKDVHWLIIEDLHAYLSHIGVRTICI